MSKGPKKWRPTIKICNDCKFLNQCGCASCDKAEKLLKKGELHLYHPGNLIGYEWINNQCVYITPKWCPEDK